MDDTKGTEPHLPPDIEAELRPPRRAAVKKLGRDRQRRPRLRGRPLPPAPPEKLSPKQRGLRIIKLSAYRNAVDRALLAELRLFDLEQGWKLDGATSCAAWLSWRTGEAGPTCRARLAVAHKLAELPLIDEAFGRGHLTYTQVRALVRRALPETQRELIELSRRMAGSKLEQLLAWIERRAAADEGPPSADQLRMWFETMPNGVVDVRVKLLPEQLPLVQNALRAVKEAVCGRKDAGRMSDSEAFVGAMELVLEGELLKSRTPVLGKYEALISVDAEVLKRRFREPLERCEVQGQRPISAATALRLTCGSARVPILVLPDGSTLDVGRRTRRVSRALLARLVDRDGHCRFPGCTRRLLLDAHHIQHWADGGETCLDNLVLTCRMHHRYVHEDGFSVRRVGGEPVFFDPHGNVVTGGAVRVDLGQDPLGRALTGIRQLGFDFTLQPRNVAAFPRLRQVLAGVTRESLDLLVRRVADRPASAS